MERWSFSKVTAAIALGGAGAFALWQLLARLYPVIVILGAGLLIAYLLDPALDRLERRGWSRQRAVWAVTAVVALAVIVAGSVGLPIVIRELQLAADNWPDYAASADQLCERAENALEGYLRRHFPTVDIMPYLDAKLDEAGAWAAEHIPEILVWASDRLARSLSLLGVVLIVAAVAFQFMMVLEPMRRQVSGLLSADGKAEVAELDREINVMLGQYLRGLALTCVTVGIATAVLLEIVGAFTASEYGVLIGALSGIIYVVPWLGTALSAAAAGLFGYVTADHHALIAGAAGLAVVLLVNQLSDSFVMPRIVGRRIGLHPLVVFFALLAGYNLGGVWGTILATPVAAALKIVLCRWLPICEEAAEAPPRRKRLTVNMRALAEQITGAFRPIARRIQNTFGEAEGDTEEEQQRTEDPRDAESAENGRE